MTASKQTVKKKPLKFYFNFIKIIIFALSNTIMINRNGIYCNVENSVAFDERPIRVGYKKVRCKIVGRAQMTHERS